MLVHLTAHAVAGTPLGDWSIAAAAWRGLRRAFPAALGATLMPDHPHLIAEVDDVDAARVTLAHILGAVTRRRGPGPWPRAAPVWAPVPPAVVIPDVAHLRRQLRYVALNPCRAGLVRDPLAWEWSTHRDVLGAVAQPWVTARALAAALSPRGRPRGAFAPAWHAYVSADPSCLVGGTTAPHPAPAAEVPEVPLARVVAAAAAATRAPDSAVRERSLTRRLFVHLAWRQGWRDVGPVAGACGVSPGAVRQLRRRPAGEGLPAGALCLGDDRLLVRGIRT